MRTEIVPCWSMTRLSLCAITGGCTGHPNEAVDAATELKEETGYKVAPDELVPLGVIRGMKAADTFYIGFTIDLTNREASEMEPASDIEALGSAMWVTAEDLLSSCQDSQALAFYAKMTVLIA